MTVKLSLAARNAALKGPGIAALLDADAGPGLCRVYSGAQPATPDTAPSGTLLATMTLNDPAFADPVAGVSVLDNTPEPAGIGVAAGTAGWFRLVDQTGDSVLDGNVSATGGGGDLEISTVAITIGLDVSVKTGTLTMPGQ